MLDRELRAQKYDVFYDIESIPAASKFPDVIEMNLRQSDVMFVTMDDQWLIDNEGQRRLNSAKDWVRREIELALELGIPIIPLLIDDAPMPSAEDLPASLRELAEIQSMRLRHRDYRADFASILVEVEALAEKKANVEKILGRVREPWSKGNWVQIHKLLSEARSDWARDQTGGSTPPVLKRRIDVSHQLMRAAEAFAQRRFDAALDILAGVPADDAPANVLFSTKVARVGTRVMAAAATGQLEVLESAWEQYLVVKAETIEKEIEIVPGLEELGKVLSEAQTEIRHGQAMAAYQAGRFRQAGGLFRELGDYRDSAKLLAVCEQWLGLFECLGKREWDKGKSVLATLGRTADPELVRRWRVWSTTMRRCVDALDTLGRGPALVDPDVPCPEGECPYAVLGLDSSADSQAIHRVSFALQARSGGMQPRERNAWDTLRHPERRLLADFCAYRVADHQRAARLAQDILSLDGDSSPDRVSGTPRQGEQGAGAQDGKSSRPTAFVIAEQLGEDAALFFRQMNMHDAAINELKRLLKAAPDDPHLLHHLGLVAAAKLRVRDELDENELAALWQTIVWAWGAIFEDDRFWHQWWLELERRRVYQLGQAQISDGRTRLRSHWLDELRAASSGGAEYDLLFQIEMNGARAVAAGGGLPVERGARRVVVGETGIRALGLQTELADWTASFDPECLSKSGFQKQVCLYFSQLAEIATLAGLERHQDVLNAQSALAIAARNEFASRNPGFARLPNGEGLLRRALNEFEEQAQHRLAVDLINESPPRVLDAIVRWRAALATAERLGRRDDLAAEAQNVIAARAAQLQSAETGDRLQQMNNVVDLLVAVRNSDLDGATITTALVDAVLDRALFMANEYSNHEAARNEALWAWSISPGTPRTLCTLYAATISLAREEYNSGQEDRARALLDAAADLHAYAEQHYLINQEIKDWNATAEAVQALLETAEPSPPADVDGSIAKLNEILKDSSLSPSSDALATALAKQAGKDYAGAIELYKRLLEQTPNDQRIRPQIESCYRAWILHLAKCDAPQDEVKEVARQAFASCPHSEMLSDLREFAGEQS